MAYIYLLQSTDEKHRYLGSTPDPIFRLQEHNNGLTQATRYKGPWYILNTWQCDSLKEARRIEYRIKKTKSALTIERISELIDYFQNNA